MSRIQISSLIDHFGKGISDLHPFICSKTVLYIDASVYGLPYPGRDATSFWGQFRQLWLAYKSPHFVSSCWMCHTLVCNPHVQDIFIDYFTIVSRHYIQGISGLDLTSLTIYRVSQKCNITISCLNLK